MLTVRDGNVAGLVKPFRDPVITTPDAEQTGRRALEVQLDHITGQIAASMETAQRPPALHILVQTLLNSLLAAIDVFGSSRILVCLWFWFPWEMLLEECR